MKEKGKAYRVLVGKPEGKMPLGRPRGRWEGNTNMVLKKEDGMVWTGFTWLRIGTSEGLL
jgi:hypothetical protein